MSQITPANRVCFCSLLFLGTIVTAGPGFGLQDEEPNARLYRSPEERREAGIRHELTSWLTGFGLAEAETGYQRKRYSNGAISREAPESSQSFQLRFEAVLSDLLTAELIFEYEIDQEEGLIEELKLAYETDAWGISAGHDNIDFGEYLSHFATGPLLEFSETRADAMTINIKPFPTLELYTFVFKGDVPSPSRNGLDFGGGVEFSTRNESFQIGMSWLSDLAESNVGFMQEIESLYQHSVAGLNTYMLLSFKEFEITFEAVTALNNFAGLDTTSNHPSAFNLELAWLPNSHWQLATRVEGSSELKDEPQWQLGLSSSWLIGRQFHVSLDYLHGNYKLVFSKDDDGNELDTRDFIAAQVSAEF